MEKKSKKPSTKQLGIYFKKQLRMQSCLSATSIFKISLQNFVWNAISILTSSIQVIYANIWPLAMNILQTTNISYGKGNASSRLPFKQNLLSFWQGTSSNLNLHRPWNKSKMRFPLFISPPTKRCGTLQGTNVSHPKALSKMIYSFPRWDMLASEKVYKTSTSWWFQTIWKIFIKLDHFPKFSGWK